MKLASLLLVLLGFSSHAFATEDGAFAEDEYEQVVMDQRGGGLGEMLKVALDNTDLHELHEKAEAIRRGDALPVTHRSPGPESALKLGLAAVSTD